MIFDKDYDNSLWYMVLSDRKNSQELLEFIKQLPPQFMERVREAIKLYKDDEPIWDVDNFYDVPGTKDEYYYFDIEDDDGMITIEKNRKITDDPNNYKDAEQLFELMLIPMSMEDLDYIDQGENEWIGTVTNAKGKEYDYEIKRTSREFRAVRERLLFNDKVELPTSVKINLDNVPEDINFENITERILKP